MSLFSVRVHRQLWQVSTTFPPATWFGTMWPFLPSVWMTLFHVEVHEDRRMLLFTHNLIVLPEGLRVRFSSQGKANRN